MSKGLTKNVKCLLNCLRITKRNKKDNKYSLTNKDYDQYVKMNIDNIIKNYLKVIINGIHSL